PLREAAVAFNPNGGKGVLDASGRALYSSRAASPWHRDGFAGGPVGPDGGLPPAHRPLRHRGPYAARMAFLPDYPRLALSPLEQVEALEQLRVRWHGFPIAVHVAENAPHAGVDTPEDLARVRGHFGA